MKLYAVGGAVRDHLRGMQGKDLDFAVEAESYDAMYTALMERGLQVWQARPEFVTLRGRMPLASLGQFGGLLPKMEPNPLGKTLPLFVAADFTLCRKEAQYSDLRHPDTVTPADLVTDLSRRDFTMNAIAVSEGGEYIDPHKGITDLRGRYIRTVGHPSDRFEEDPLRMLRAIRFAVTLKFWLDSGLEETLGWPWLVEKLPTLPVERVVNELQLALKVDWQETMRHLMISSPLVGDALFGSFPDLWLKATTEDR
jgi:tRNA nucleotidyltransferase/poly(A) polymerase